MELIQRGSFAFEDQSFFDEGLGSKPQTPKRQKSGRLKAKRQAMQYRD
jgi:hypothetical protein